MKEEEIILFERYFYRCCGFHPVQLRQMAVGDTEGPFNGLQCTFHEYNG